MSHDSKNSDASFHEYDGIKENDNPLPMWWLWTFFGTIIFGFIYYIHFGLHIGPNSDEELNLDLTEIASLQKNAPSTFDEKKFLAISSDAAAIERGRVEYVAKCVSCHGDKGQGLIGPNLTDKFWIHGEGKPDALFAVIAKGVLEKGMPAWEAMLKPEQIFEVLGYILTLKGTNPPGAKPSEGIEVN